MSANGQLKSEAAELYLQLCQSIGDWSFKSNIVGIPMTMIEPLIGGSKQQMCYKVEGIDLSRRDFASDYSFYDSNGPFQKGVILCNCTLGTTSFFPGADWDKLKFSQVPTRLAEDAAAFDSAKKLLREYTTLQ